jgi:hypothetical protein
MQIKKNQMDTDLGSVKENSEFICVIPQTNCNFCSLIPKKKKKEMRQQHHKWYFTLQA